jgi:DHA1 family tetracycline resistance protein-like MFS transporter
MPVEVLSPGPPTKALRERTTVLVGIACACIALGAMALAHEGWIVFAIMPIFALGDFGTPAFQAIAARQVDPTSQGQLQRVMTSAVSLVSIITPLGFTTFYFVVQKQWPGAIRLSVVVVYVVVVSLAFIGTRPTALRVRLACNANLT